MKWTCWNLLKRFCKISEHFTFSKKLLFLKNVHNNFYYNYNKSERVLETLSNDISFEDFWHNFSQINGQINFNINWMYFANMKMMGRFRLVSSCWSWTYLFYCGKMFRCVDFTLFHFAICMFWAMEQYFFNLAATSMNRSAFFSSETKKIRIFWIGYWF